MVVFVVFPCRGTSCMELFLRARISRQTISSALAVATQDSRVIEGSLPVNSGSEVGGWVQRSKWWQEGGSADSAVDNAGDERGLESTITILGVGCRIGGPGFGNCVEFDSVASPGETIIGGKNMGTGVGFSVGNCWR